MPSGGRKDSTIAGPEGWGCGLVIAVHHDGYLTVAGTRNGSPVQDAMTDASCLTDNDGSTQPKIRQPAPRRPRRMIGFIGPLGFVYCFPLDSPEIDVNLGRPFSYRGSP
jgi:hypothetical protein